MPVQAVVGVGDGALVGVEVGLLVGVGVEIETHFSVTESHFFPDEQLIRV